MTGRTKQNEVLQGISTLQGLCRHLLAENDATFAETVSMRVRRVFCKEAKAVIESLAAALTDRWGREGVIGLYGESGVEWLFCFWAILRSGNTPCLLPCKEKNAEPPLQMRGTVYLNSPPNGAEDALSYGNLQAKGASLSPLDGGAPFGESVWLFDGERYVLWERDALLDTAKLLCAKKTKENDRLTVCFPLSHPVGFFHGCLAAGLQGATLVFPSSGSVEAVMRSARRVGVTSLVASPLFWEGVERLARREWGRRCAAAGKPANRLQTDADTMKNGRGKLWQRAARKRYSVLRGELFGDTLRVCIVANGVLSEETRALLGVIGYPLGWTPLDGASGLFDRPGDLVVLENQTTVNKETLRKMLLRVGGDFPRALLYREDTKRLLLLLSLPKTLQPEAWQTLRDSVESEIKDTPIDALYTVEPLCAEDAFALDEVDLLCRISSGELATFTTAFPEGGETITEQLRRMLADLLDLSPSEIGLEDNIFTDLGCSSLDYYAFVGDIDARFGTRIPFEAEHFSYTLADLEKIVKEQLGHV